MTIDELISKLEEIKGEYGNLDVITWNCEVDNLGTKLNCNVAFDIEYLDEDEFLVSGDVVCL